MFPHRRFSRWLLACLALLALAACGNGGGGGGGGKGVTTPVGDKPVIVATAPFGMSESCPNGGVRVDWGIDKNGNGTLDPGEITGGGDVCNGGNGQPMVAEAVPFTGADGPCLNGGVRIDMGLDLDGDTGLGEDEITDHAYICDGAAGIAALIVTDVEPPGAHCAYGGLKIRSGQDTNGNLSLDDETGVSTNYVCNVGNMPLIQVPAADSEPWSSGAVALGSSTWDRINGKDGDEWLTFGEPTFRYSPYILVNNSTEVRALDVTGLWADGLGGNLTVYPYPFNPLRPLNPAPADWNTHIWRYTTAWNEDETVNLAPLILAPHQAVVLVASADDPGHVAASADLTFTPYLPMDASAGAVTVSGQTVAPRKSRSYKVSRLPNQADMNAPVYSPVEVRLTGMAGTASVSAYPEPHAVLDAIPPDGCSAEGANPACHTPHASVDGALWIRVEGAASGDPATFDLTATLPTNQGTTDAPVIFPMGVWDDPGMPGSVGTGYSYYAVTSGFTVGQMIFVIAFAEGPELGQGFSMVLTESGANQGICFGSGTTATACVATPSEGATMIKAELHIIGTAVGDFFRINAYVNSE